MSEIVGLGTDSGEGATAGDVIKDATIESFEQDVLEASMTTPVVVDFWAEWCGPCKQLAPALEKAVTAAGGAVRLVKVDIDKNQMLASQLRIQSIPTVYAFFQGRPVDGFQGAVPESEIKAFIERLTSMTGDQGGASKDPTEDYLNAGEAALGEGDIAAAAQLFAQVAQSDPANIRALAGLAQCHLGAGDVEKASEALALVPEEQKSDPILSSIFAAISLASDNPGGDQAALRAAAEANPDDLKARFELASALLGAGSMEAAMEELLAIIERDQGWDDDAARKKLLTVFEALGPTHPATIKGRRKLSSLLFS